MSVNSNQGPSGTVESEKQNTLESNNGEQPDEGLGGMGETICAFVLHMSSNKLGVASYNTFTNVLSVTEVFVFVNDLGDVLYRLQSHILPTVIVFSFEEDEAFRENLQENHTALQAEHPQLQKLDLIQQKTFTFQFSKARSHFC